MVSILLLLLLSCAAGSDGRYLGLKPECVLLSGTFAILLQVMIGIGALTEPSVQAIRR